MGLLPLPTASQNAGYLTDGINQNKLRKELAATKKNGFAETLTSASKPSNPASLTKNYTQVSSDSKEKDKIDRTVRHNTDLVFDGEDKHVLNGLAKAFRTM